MAVALSVARALLCAGGRCVCACDVILKRPSGDISLTMHAATITTTMLLLVQLLLLVLALAEAAVEVEVLLMVLLAALGSGCFVRPRCRRESNPTHRPERGAPPDQHMGRLSCLARVFTCLCPI